MQNLVISKSQFKPKALEYLREVEKKKKPITITHGGKPVVQIVPIEEEDDDKILKELGDAIISINGDITEPIGEDDWEVLK